MNLLKHFLCISILIVSILYITKNVKYNWDIVFYVGSIFHDKYNIEESRIKTISALKKSPYLNYDEIDPKTSYGKSVFSNNQSYAEQYPFYQIRFVYNSFIKFFYKVGLDSAYSVYLTSKIFALLSILLIYIVSFTISKNHLISLVIGLFIITQNGFREYITSSPDTLSAFSLLLVIISYLKDKKVWLFLSIIFALLARTDNIIFIFILILCSFFYDFFTKKKLSLAYNIGLMSISLFIYFIVNTIYDNAGFRVLFYHTFIEHLPFPITNPQKITFAQYITTIKPQLPYLIHSAIFYLLFIILAMNKNINKPYLLIVLFSTISTFTIKFLLFPSSSDRFIFQYLLIASIWLIYFFSSNIQKTFKYKSGSICS